MTVCTRMRVVFALMCLAAAAMAVHPLKTLSKRELKFNTWAVLIAGSKGIINYRHQAGVCHAYQAIHNLGVPEEHIIVMMEDDIAYNSNNPWVFGKLFNSPAEENGTDVYLGVPHDYTNGLVTLNNFRDVLLGREMKVGSGKTLRSGPDDNVFVFYSGHGNFDLIGFPDGKTMSSGMLEQLLNVMSNNKQFKNLVFYLESCYSGSMFFRMNIPPNVFVTTAAPVDASSYSGCNGCCDAYSYVWISDLEQFHPSDYSFKDQFSLIGNEVDLSQTCSYGSDDVSNLFIRDFFGPSIALTRSDPPPPLNLDELVPNDEFELWWAKHLYEKNPSEENKREVERQVAIKNAINDMGIAIVSSAMPRLPYLATTPCGQKCESSCPCFYECMYYNYNDTDYCHFACCNENSCTEEYYTSLRSGVFESCMDALTRQLNDKCHQQHPYLFSLNQQFRRVCKFDDVNITVALKEIEEQCASFDESSF